MRAYKNKNQLLILVLVVGFLIGILYQNLLYMKGIVSLELFSEHVLRRFLQLDIIVEKYLWFVCKERLLAFGVICLLGCIKWKKTIIMIHLFIHSFLAGIFVVTSVLQLGIKGILICLTGIFPHGLFYGMAYGILFAFLFAYPNKSWNRVKTLFVALMMIIGILTESYVNPFILKLVIQI